MAQLPLRYSVRNLLRRRTRTALTVVGLALVVSVIVFMLAFSSSLASTLRETGDPDNMIIISKKSQTFVLSSIAERETELIRNKLYDAAATFERKDEWGTITEPIISAEVYMGLNVEVQDAQTFRSGAQRGVLHGVDPQLAMELNSHVRLVEGRLPVQDAMEVIVGCMAATRLGVADEDLGLGSKIRFLNQIWTVVGRFEATGTIMESEIWSHVEDLRLYLKRQDYSFMKVKLSDPSRMEELCSQLSLDEQFSVKAFAERTYFADYAEGFDFFRQFAHALVLITIVGGVVVGLNTMYTAVMGRVREIGTLQVIGFSKKSVLLGILAESLVIALVSGILGCGLGYLANGLPMKIPMAAFRVTVSLDVFVLSVAASLFIGCAGAFLPALRALRLRMVDAVRYQ